MSDRSVEQPAVPSAQRTRPELAEFLRTSVGLGLVGFGGGVSVLATIERTMVSHRRWLTEREFVNTATVAQMLPGGAAANVLAYVGLRFHGVRGALAGYVGFVAPGAVLVAALAWLYARFGTVPRADAFLSGLNAALVGIIIAITVRMARTGVRRLWQMGVAGTAVLLAMLGGAGSLELVFLGISAGLVWDLGIERALLLRHRRRRWRPAPPVALPEEGKPLPRASAAAAQDPPRCGSTSTLRAIAVAAVVPVLWSSVAHLVPLAVVFFKTGLGAYGGGFAIIPSLHSDVVARGWLTERQFADAVAVGKLTPGPVLLMATFIGYLRGGFSGALVSTVAIFVAPLFLVVLLATWLDRVRSKRWMRAALRGLTPAVVGLMVAAGLTLGRTMQTGAGLAIAAVVGLTLVRFERLNPVGMLALGGVTRLVLRIFWGI